VIRHVFFLCVLIMSVLVCNVSQAITYKITDLGTCNGYLKSRAYGINASGQVVGKSYGIGYDDTLTHAFFYNGSTMTDLGTLGGSLSEANHINASGQVVGYSYTTGDLGSHAFIYNGSTMTDLGTLGGRLSEARDINDSGQVVGDSQITGTITHAFLYSGSTMTDLGTLGGRNSDAISINASGQIVGDSLTASNIQHAFLYSGSTMTDLGTLGGRTSVAYDINNSGQIVGWSQIASGETHAFIYDGLTMTDLGTFGGSSYAAAINNSGQIVGKSYHIYETIDVDPVAVIFNGSTMIDLNTLIDDPLATGLKLEEALDINDAGQIVGQGYDLINMEEHAYLLTPVPEPATLMLLGSALLGLGWRIMLVRRSVMRWW
jgi:probable HAF family extracellular repeat protein